MSLISETFEHLADRNEAALIAYVTGGDPNINSTKQIIPSLAEAGADIVEIGIPFSDPIADGPTLQAAAGRALKNRTTPASVLQLVAEVKRRTTIPIVLLTYYNLIYRMGLENFFESSERFGVDGVVVPDLPVEESVEYTKMADLHGVDTIFLAAPSTSNQRLKRIATRSSGFLYLTSLYGVTGARRSLDRNLPRLITRTRRLARGLPVCVGFGISTADHVSKVTGAGARGAIVGSALVELIAKYSSHKTFPAPLLRTVRGLKAATRPV